LVLLEMQEYVFFQACVIGAAAFVSWNTEEDGS
jgi:hypothetical protein